MCQEGEDGDALEGTRTRPAQQRFCPRINAFEPPTFPKPRRDLSPQLWHAELPARGGEKEERGGEKKKKNLAKSKKKQQSHLKIFSFWETFGGFNNPVSVLYVDVINLK